MNQDHLRGILIKDPAAKGYLPGYFQSLCRNPLSSDLPATANLCTIFHITALSVDYFSTFVKEPDIIRFFKLSTEFLI